MNIAHTIVVTEETNINVIRHDGAVVHLTELRVTVIRDDDYPADFIEHQTRGYPLNAKGKPHRGDDRARAVYLPPAARDTMFGPVFARLERAALDCLPATTEETEETIP